MPADSLSLPDKLQRCRSFLRAAGSSAAGAGNSENEWEALCPELFALIVKAVQQNAGREAGEARRVVALAGVCRRWRYLIQQFYSSPLAEIGLLQFPFALRQPGPCNRPVQCLLKRKGSTFVLFQQNVGEGGGAEKLDFLMAARKEWRASGACFAISASHTCFSKAGHAYMGKLRSDFWGTDFNLWEVCGSTQNKPAKRLAISISFSDCLQEGLRHRSMTCQLFTIPKRATSRQLNTLPPPPTTTPPPPPTARSEPSAPPSSAIQTRSISLPFAAPSLFSCFTASGPARPRPSKPKAAPTFLRSYSSLRRANYAAAQLVRNASARHSRELGQRSSSENSIIMESKPPRWDEQSQYWSLDFHGRASLPSHYSFQLIQPATTGSPGQASHESDQSPQDKNHIIFLQLGKVGKGLYTVDFCHPFSAFQAFSICLSSFATKVGVEP